MNEIKFKTQINTKGIFKKSFTCDTHLEFLPENEIDIKTERVNTLHLELANYIFDKNIVENKLMREIICLDEFSDLLKVEMINSLYEPLNTKLYRHENSIKTIPLKDTVYRKENACIVETKLDNNSGVTSSHEVHLLFNLNPNTPKPK